MNFMQYNHQKIENSSQEKWKSKPVVKGGFQKYILEMFPYPSGNLHMGHVRNYTIGDVITRFNKLNGVNVLHPIGWDAFGLPAENAAMEFGLHPKDWTLSNIANMKTQFKALGFDFNWEAEITTCLPDYYKHSQSIFLDFLEHGIAYRKKSFVNWDPVDNTVLANEQVIDGRGWRSGALIEQKELNQWFLKVSDFSQNLLDGLETIPNWPEKVKTMQENWIGKSQGVEVEFGIVNGEKITVFTTRPETLFGASFIGISARHSLVGQILKNNLDDCKANVLNGEDDHRTELHGSQGAKASNSEDLQSKNKIANFVRECNAATQKDLDTQEKKGIFTGLYAFNPVFKKKEVDLKGLSFRPLQESDEEDIDEVLRTADEFLSVKQGAIVYINKSINDYKGYGYGYDAVMFKGKVIGFGGMMYSPKKHFDAPEFGYVIHKDFQRKGFGSAIAKHYINVAFYEHNLPKLLASVDMQNKVSVKVTSRFFGEPSVDSYLENRFLFILENPSKGLTFRPLQNSDLPRLEELLDGNDEYMIYKQDRASYYIESSIEGYKKHGYGYDAFVLNGTIIGFGGITDGSSRELNGVAFIFVIGKEYHGKGYSKVIIQYYINKAFYEVQTHQINAIIVTENKPSIGVVSKFMQQQEGIKRIPNFEKDNYLFTLKNPALVPIYIANFVLMEYGTGAVFGCPAHDERDFEFAMKYGLQIKRVISQNENAILETKRFYLRPFAELDRKIFLQWCEESGAMDERYQNIIWSNSRINKWTQNNIAPFAVFDKTTNELVGYAGFELFNDNIPPYVSEADLEFGYRFATKYWGTGVGTEVASLLCEWITEKFPYHKIFATTTQNNVASQRVLQKCGFGFVKQINTEKCGDGYLYKYNFPIKKVIEGAENLPYTEKSGMMVNSYFLNGKNVGEAFNEIVEYLENNKLGKRKITYRLRDWGISRQRYWGCPIPIIYCEKCGVVPVPKEQLPVQLPEDVNIEAGENPLKKHPTWKNCKCPKCGKDSERETDTFDTFFESSWYFLRFCSPKSEKPFEDTKPVDLYIGGVEHAILHLLYSRFFVMALRKCGYEIYGKEEPFRKLVTQGMVCHKTFKKDGKWLSPEEAIGSDGKLLDNVEVGKSIKMSKSKKNIVSPVEIIEKYGADTARFFIISDSPIERDFDWSNTGISATNKFLQRIWKFADKVLSLNVVHKNSTQSQDVHKIVAEYTFNMENLFLNKVIANLYTLFSTIEKLSEDEIRFAFGMFLQMLFPVCPHISDTLYSNIFSINIETISFPKVNKTSLKQKIYKVTIQIDGKMKTILEFSKEPTQDDVVSLLEGNDKIASILKMGVRIIFIKGRVLNVITK